MCLAVDEKEAVLGGRDVGRLGRVHDLDIAGLAALGLLIIIIIY